MQIERESKSGKTDFAPILSLSETIENLFFPTSKLAELVKRTDGTVHLLVHPWFLPG
jgi:hypothetical protein